MKPAEVSQALDRLQAARIRAGMPEPQEVGPELTDEDFAHAEEFFGFVLPEPLREWFRWRNGVPVSSGYPEQLLVDPWTHMTLQNAMSWVEMFREILTDAGIPVDVLDDLMPLLGSDSWTLVVDVTSPDLDVHEFHLGRVVAFRDGPTCLLGAIEMWTDQLDSSTSSG